MVSVRDFPLYEWGATADLLTGKIEGCSVGSRTWYHESRHVWQFEKMGRSYTGLSVLSTLSAVVAAFGLLMGDFRILMYGVAGCVPIALLTGILEFDAELYAWMHWFRNTEMTAERGKEGEDV